MNILSAQAPLHNGPFPFLSLPLEIRHQIYSELLIASVSSTSKTETEIIWHDRENRHRPRIHLYIYPKILQANKQINAEATPILYAHNKFKIAICSTVMAQCSGGMYADSRRGGSSPPYLFRSDGLEQRTPDYFDSDKPGFIYPYCLQRIENIEIAILPMAIWGSSVWGRPGGFFSHIGMLLVEILQLLAAEKDGNDAGIADEDHQILQGKKKRLILTIYKNDRALFPKKRVQLRELKRQEQEDEGDEEVYRSEDERFSMEQDQEEDERFFGEQDQKAAQIPLLTEAVARNRDVEIAEVEPFSELGVSSQKSRKIELEDFENL
ncbi:MAG: hypothetical protein Q9221_002444 [Calogaya cf. arnoldii]